MATVEIQIQKCKHYLQGNLTDDKVLFVLDQLKKLSLSIDVLQSTGIGKIVNGLRKRDGIVGEKARNLVKRWKNRVADEAHGIDIGAVNDNGQEDDDLKERLASTSSSQERVTDGGDQVSDSSSKKHRRSRESEAKGTKQFKDRDKHSSRKELDSEVEESVIKLTERKSTREKKKESSAIKKMEDAKKFEGKKSLPNDIRKIKHDSQDILMEKKKHEKKKPSLSGEDIAIRSSCVSDAKHEKRQKQDKEHSRNKPDLDVSSSRKRSHEHQNDLEKSSPTHKKHKSRESRHERRSGSKEEEDSLFTVDKVVETAYKSRTENKLKETSEPVKEPIRNNMYSLEKESEMLGQGSKSKGVATRNDYTGLKNTPEKHKDMKESKIISDNNIKQCDNSHKIHKKHKSKTKTHSSATDGVSKNRDANLFHEEIEMNQKVEKPTKTLSKTDSIRNLDKHSQKETSSDHSCNKAETSTKHHSQKETSNKAETSTKHQSQKETSNNHSVNKAEMSAKHDHTSHKHSKEKSRSKKPPSKKEDIRPESFDDALFGDASLIARKPPPVDGDYQKIRDKYKVKKKGTRAEKRDDSAKKPKTSAEFTVPQPQNKVKLTDEDIMSYLPQTNSHYRPWRFSPMEDKGLSDAAAGVDLMLIGSKASSTRTKMYSGRKQTFVPELVSLYNICMKTLIENIDSIDHVGGIPYDILHPVLERCTPVQLYTLEDYNAHFLEDTDGLWKLHAAREFKGSEPDEMETWRELYLRKYDEREAKLKALKANISESTAKRAEPVRKTMLAFVDTYVKPPRDVLRKQARYGTAAIVSSSRMKRPEASSFNPMAVKPRQMKPVAPIMQKTLKMMKKMRY